MFGIGKYIAIAAAVCIALMAGVIWYQHRENGVLTQNLATERASVATLKGTIVEQNRQQAEFIAKLEADREKLGQLSERANTIQTERDNAIAKFNDYRTRLGKAAMGRPTLVGRLASKSVARLMCQFRQASGGATCDDGGKAVRSTAPGADKPPAPQDRGSDSGSHPPAQ